MFAGALTEERLRNTGELPPISELHQYFDAAI